MSFAAVKKRQRSAPDFTNQLDLFAQPLYRYSRRRLRRTVRARPEVEAEDGRADRLRRMILSHWSRYRPKMLAELRRKTGWSRRFGGDEERTHRPPLRTGVGEEDGVPRRPGKSRYGSGVPAGRGPP